MKHSLDDAAFTFDYFLCSKVSDKPELSEQPVAVQLWALNGIKPTVGASPDERDFNTNFEEGVCYGSE